MVYIILGTGFEEVEAVIPCDLLRRAGVEVQFAGIGARAITGSNGITVTADCTVQEAALTEAEMIVLPGGLGGVRSICGCREVLDAVQQVYRSGGYVAAICAAPTVLAELGITEGKRATCYPGMEPKMRGALLQTSPAVADGRVITGRAAGTAFAFALKLVAALRGEEAAKQVAGGIVYRQEVQHD